MNHDISNLASKWTRAGAMFLAQPARERPDMEILLLETSRAASAHARLFIMAASWLSLYGDRISTSRLANLIRSRLEPEYQPVMGLMLEIAQQWSRSTRFEEAIAECSPAQEAGPLFEIHRMNPTLWRIAERKASTISRRWNRWAEEFKPKYDAIRSPTPDDITPLQRP